VRLSPFRVIDAPGSGEVPSPGRSRSVHHHPVRLALLVLATLETVLITALPAPANPDKPGVDGGIRTAAAQLRGAGPPVDLIQDYIGARSLVGHGDPYEILTQAYASVGIVWPAEHRSTHPPTAFVLTLPIAWLRWKIAAAVWAWLMLAAIAGAWWALGTRAELAAALGPLTLLWPPAAWSMGQLTPLWLLGIALAWRWRKDPLRSGASIGVAALTKLLPALSLGPFLLVRRWRTLIGYAAAFGFALVVVLILRPGVVTRYLSLSRSVGREQAARPENSALLWAFDHRFGLAGTLAAAGLIACVLGASVMRLRSREHLDAWSFWAWSWAGVALLPIAWIYSLLPLVPALAYCLRRGGLVSRALAAFAISVPFAVDPFGLPGGIRLAFATASVGLSLLLVPYATVSLAWARAPGS
jgi:hypothetical protein